jgi:two-component system CheB/CheR fusion protein
MSNALKFTPAEGSIRVQAIYLPKSEDTLAEHFELQDGQIVSGYSRGSLRVRVIDTGAGMSKDQVDNLFQEGVQFNANELQAGGGSGLGLYIAKGIVSQHSGNLSASSEGLDHGTTFEMFLPLWEITSSNDSDTKYDVEAGMAVEDHGSGTNTMTNHSLVFPKTKLKVLVVDDVKSNRKLLRRILENKGHECDEAVDGQECVDMVRKAGEEEMPYDSILLDYEMPGMDGPTAAKEIRCTLLDYDTNIVGVTGNVLPEDVNYFKKCGANDVLPKPVKIVDLCASWETHCILSTNNNSRQELHHA